MRKPPPLTRKGEPRDLPSGTSVRVVDNHHAVRHAVTDGVPFRYRVKNLTIYLVRLRGERIPVPLGRVWRAP